MRLRQFRVRRFRNIVDSGVIDVETDVTCLVGKNEAGKSALLEALYLLNPAYGEEFNLDEQYPRWLLAQDRRVKNLSELTPIEATFELAREDVEGVYSAFDHELTDTALPTITLAKTYGGEIVRSIEIDEHIAIEAALSSVGSRSGIPSSILNAGTLAELDRALETAFDGMAETAPLHGRLSKVQAIRSRQEAELDNVVDALPVFFHFSDYQTMPGRVLFKDLADPEAGLGRPGAGGLQAARALVKLAGTEPTALSADDYDLRRAELDAVQIELTNQVFEYWRQNQNLRVQIDVDKENVRNNSGEHSVANVLHIRVMDNRTGYGNNFDQRSSGFQWFFSFLAAFSEFEFSQYATVVLLDEPGLSLHGRAQEDYLRFIDERLAPGSQVLYTTHSPFMLRANQLERVRLVEDKGPDEWAVVSRDVVASDPDSVFPLQAALGYDIAQNLFIGPNNLVVEGTSDFTYLTVLSDYMNERDLGQLDDDWRIVAAGGSTNIPTFVALIGPHLDVTVLVDSSQKGMQRLLNAQEEGLLPPDRLVTVGSILDRRNADVEDLFSVADYIRLYNGAFDTSINVQELPQGDRILERLERGGAGHFDHGKPADYLLRHRTEIEFSDETVDNFVALFERINRTL